MNAIPMIERCARGQRHRNQTEHECLMRFARIALHPNEQRVAVMTATEILNRLRDMYRVPITYFEER